MAVKVIWLGILSALSKCTLGSRSDVTEKQTCDRNVAVTEWINCVHLQAVPYSNISFICSDSKPKSTVWTTMFRRATNSKTSTTSKTSRYTMIILINYINNEQTLAFRSHRESVMQGSHSCWCKQERRSVVFRWCHQHRILDLWQLCPTNQW